MTYPWGDSIDLSKANYCPLYGPAIGTTPVGYYDPNGYGLRDMAGNVWQWCWDWCAVNPPANGSSDPRGLTAPTNGHYRMLRAMSWFDNYWFAFRCSFRECGGPPDDNYGEGYGGVLGFRCARGQ